MVNIIPNFLPLVNIMKENISLGVYLLFVRHMQLFAQTILRYFNSDDLV